MLNQGRKIDEQGEHIQVLTTANETQNELIKEYDEQYKIQRSECRNLETIAMSTLEMQQVIEQMEARLMQHNDHDFLEKVFCPEQRYFDSQGTVGNIQSNDTPDFQIIETRNQNNE